MRDAVGATLNELLALEDEDLLIPRTVVVADLRSGDVANA
jgi:hypothetical protein